MNEKKQRYQMKYRWSSPVKSATRYQIWRVVDSETGEVVKGDAMFYTKSDAMYDSYQLNRLLKKEG